MPRPSNMKRSVYFVLGVIAVRLLWVRQRRANLLCNLRNAGF